MESNKHADVLPGKDKKMQVGLQSAESTKQQALRQREEKSGVCLPVAIWVEQIVPHRLDVGMVLGL